VLREYTDYRSKNFILNIQNQQMTTLFLKITWTELGSRNIFSINIEIQEWILEVASGVEVLPRHIYHNVLCCA
jgi:hypothetical protein